MEFWGVEVKPGKPLKVKAEDEILIHISQASLGDCKGKKGETVPLYVKVGDQKLVLGTLQTENIPQLSCDLVFQKEFELSHSWGKGSVYFTGYKAPNYEDDWGEDFSDSEEEEEDVEEVPATITANGNAAKAVAKPKAKPAEVKKNVKPVAADDDEEDDSDSEDGMDNSDDDDEDSEEEETPTPKKPASSKKRANEGAPTTPVSSKKAKAAVTAQKTEEKKKGGPATPHPAKKGGKTPTTATQSPKSASYVSCDSCKKTFNSGNALESHTKAKHAAAK